MNFVRHTHLPADRKHVHLGPCPGGYFWALEGCNDLPKIGVKLAKIDAQFALENATVYMQDVEKPNSWERLLDVEKLKDFRTYYPNDVIEVIPYMPEFYIVPDNTIQGYKIKLASGYVPDVMTEDLFCPNCDRETVWDVTTYPTLELKCLECGKTENFEGTIS